MTAYKYLVGQEVRHWPEHGENAPRGEVYIVARLLPELQGVPQYRITPKVGGAERVVPEARLSPFAPLRVVPSAAFGDAKRGE
jgi:hypothetical protein